MCLYETQKRELEAMVHIVSEGGDKAQTEQAVLELKDLMSVVKHLIPMCDDLIKYEGKVLAL